LELGDIVSLVEKAEQEIEMRKKLRKWRKNSVK